MAVTQIRTEYGTGEGSADKDRRNTFALNLLVYVNNVNDGPAVILAHPSVPKVGDEYATGNDYDPGSFCQSVKVERDPTVETLFRVTCEYDNSKPDKAEPNPLLRPAKFNWSNRREEFYLPRDTRGKYYRTPAGLPLENPPPTPMSLLVLTITRNVATFNPIAMNLAMDAVNLDYFLGWAPGYAKIEDIVPSDLQYEGEYQYYALETTIAFRRIPWHPHLEIAKGRHAKDGSGNLVPNSAAGVMTDHEEYLNEDGTKRDEGLDPILMEFYPFPELAYSSLSQFTGITPGW